MESNSNSNSSDHSIFAKRTGGNLKLSTEPTPLTNHESGFSNIFNKVKGYVKLGSNDEESNLKVDESLPFLERTKKKILNFIEVEKSYTLFFTFIAVGIGLIFLSLLFLPMAVLAPQKFVSLFSLGSFVTLISFIFIYGTSAYLGMLFTNSRAIFSTLFIISIFLGLYFCFFNQTYYLIALFCALIQLITLIIFILSFIPGGSMGISFFTSMLMSPARSFINKFTGA
jgi:hypothetical protein